MSIRWQQESLATNWGFMKSLASNLLCEQTQPMRRASLLSSIFITAALLGGCGGPPESARQAQHYLAQGQFDKADSAADRALQEHPKDPTSWRVKIRVAMGRGALEEAVALYREWKSLHGKHDSTAYRMMAMSDLWQALQVPSPEIQARAVSIVEQHQIEKLADDVRKLLGSDSDLVAAAASAALITSHPAAPRIAVDLLSSDNPRARAIVVRSIGKKAGRIARADVYPALTDKSPLVRRAAVAAIASWKNSDDSPRLVKVAGSDSDPQVRAGAMRSLLSKGGEAAMLLARKKLSPEGFDPYLGARLAAVAVLDTHGGAEDQALFLGLRGSEDLSMALRAARALHRREKQDNRALLDSALSSDKPATRSSALNSAATLLSKEQALAFARRALHDPTPSVQLAAARLLLNLSPADNAPDDAIFAMKEALKSPTHSMKLQAASDLAQRGDTDAIALLSRLAIEGSPEEREAAIYAHKNAAIISEGLISALGDSSIAIRLAASDVILGS